MTTIAELVTVQIPQTEADLQSGGLSDFAAIKTQAIQRSKLEFYVTATIPDEDLINDLVKFYLSDGAVLFLIDPAIDWYQSSTLLSETQGSDQTIKFYDRVSSLRTKREELLERIGKVKDLMMSIAFGTDDPADIAGLPVAQMQAEKRVKITNDPWQYARYLYGDLIEIAEGVEPITIQVDRP